MWVLSMLWIFLNWWHIWSWVAFVDVEIGSLLVLDMEDLEIVESGGSEMLVGIHKGCRVYAFYCHSNSSLFHWQSMTKAVEFQMWSFRAFAKSLPWMSARPYALTIDSAMVTTFASIRHLDNGKNWALIPIWHSKSKKKTKLSNSPYKA